MLSVLSFAQAIAGKNIDSRTPNAIDMITDDFRMVFGCESSMSPHDGEIKKYINIAFHLNYL